MIFQNEFHKQVSGSSSKVTKTTKLLRGVKKYLAKKINKKLGIIMEAVDISIEAGIMMRRVC